MVDPYLGDTVAVRGLSSGRRWLRVPRIDRERSGALNPVSALEPFAPHVGGALTVADSEAFLAFDRSVKAGDPLASVITLWDAINFYAAGVVVEPLFTREDIKPIIASLPTTLTPQQKAVLHNKLNGVNDPPLWQRLMTALERDGITLSDGDLAVLKRLRAIRNPAQHGTTPPFPTEEDLARGWSIVGRMLLHRAFANRTRTNW